MTLNLDSHIDSATQALLAQQHADGHFLFELEADATIPAEYVLLRHYLGEPVDAALESGIAAYLRRIQGAHGGWPLFCDGAFDMSATVKAYFALKMIGDSPQAEHMRRARDAVRLRGGAERSNVFTRCLLALYGIIPWRAVPVMPVEIMLLPKWFPFHLDKISYWSRTVIVPLLALMAKKPCARNPKGISITELFLEPPQQLGPAPRAPHQKASWFWFFRVVDDVLRAAEPWFPKSMRQRAIDRAVGWVEERLNGEDGLGAIFPAMANGVMMFDALGVPADDPRRAIARKSVDKLLAVHDDETYCQPCVSPIWDTGLACHALIEAGAFQYANPHYPDVDDTAVVAMALDRMQGLGQGDYRAAIDRAREWIVGMQSVNGGWGAFDADNEYYYLNNIPFADHGALLDPPTEDVGARCLSMLAQLRNNFLPRTAGEEDHAQHGGGGSPNKPPPPPAGRSPSPVSLRSTGEDVRSATDDAAAERAIAYLRRTQRPDGSWFGRWGMNYIYGTWSVLSALNAAGFAPDAPEMGKAVEWLAAIQNPDGGWGEDGSSYKLDYHGYEPAPSTASQTAWALLGLMAAGAIDHPAVACGIKYLAENQAADGFWNEPRYTATGFPRVFYLRYHGYAKYFPLWALARYRNLRRGNAQRVAWGM